MCKCVDYAQLGRGTFNGVPCTVEKFHDTFCRGNHHHICVAYGYNYTQDARDMADKLCFMLGGTPELRVSAPEPVEDKIHTHNKRPPGRGETKHAIRVRNLRAEVISLQSEIERLSSLIPSETANVVWVSLTDSDINEISSYCFNKQSVLGKIARQIVASRTSKEAK